MKRKESKEKKEERRGREGGKKKTGQSSQAAKDPSALSRSAGRVAYERVHIAAGHAAVRQSVFSDRLKARVYTGFDLEGEV